MAQLAIGSGLNPAPGGAAGAGSGTVTSVNASLTFTTSSGAVTTSGTIALSWSAQAAGKAFIGPASGAAAAPTFRVLDALDIPALAYAPTSHTHNAGTDLTAGLVPLARGGTNADLSATGGSSQVLKQSSAGAAVTVGQLAQADISGLGTSDSPQFTGVNIGHATDSTVTRSAAGKLAVEGKAVPLMSGAVDLVLAGPTLARTWTGPDADATLLYSGGALGTPSSGTLTNATGLPLSGLATQADQTVVGNVSGGVAVPIALSQAQTRTFLGLAGMAYIADAPSDGSTYGRLNGAWAVAGGGSGANTALSNLAAVAINTSLVSDADYTDDIGTSAIRWKDIYATGLVLSGSYASEQAPALTDGNWTVGAGWESPIVGPGLIKNATGTGTQTPSAATTIVAGTLYRVVITLSAWSVGSAAYMLGGTTGQSSLAAATTYTDYILATTTGKLIIMPTSTSRFTISAISIMPLVAGSNLISSVATEPLVYRSGGGNPAHIFNTEIALNADAKIASFRNNNVEKLHVADDGTLGIGTVTVSPVADGLTMSASGGNVFLNVARISSARKFACGVDNSIGGQGFFATYHNSTGFACGGCAEANSGISGLMVIAGNRVSLDATSYAATGDSGISKSATSGGTVSYFYDAAEILRDNGTNVRWLASRRPGSYNGIADTNPLCAYAGLMASVSATATIANTTTETTLFGTLVGTATLPASPDLRVGSIIRVGARGFHSCLTGTPGNVTINVKIGTLVVATATFAGTSAAANQFFGVACDIRVQATGASGTVWAQGELDVAVAGVITRIPLVTTAVSAAIDFTATKVVDITWTWATADAGNTVTSTNPFVEVLP